MEKSIVAQSNPVVGILIIAGMIIVPLLWFWMMRFVALKLSKWEKLMKEFSDTAVAVATETYPRMTCYIGFTQFRRSFTIQLTGQGVRLIPSFARRSPILIPWQKIDDVAVAATPRFGVLQYMLFTVGWDRELRFSLPQDALPTVRQRMPAERIRNSDPVSWQRGLK